MKILFLIFLLVSCSTKNNKINQNILQLLVPISQKATYLFSYPGREIHESKKRYVLDYLLNKIETSKEIIEIYAYSFNHPEIIQALKKAKNRGVKITFLLDSEKSYAELNENDFEYRVWKGSGLHHIKAILFDKKSIFLGTGNFSKFGLTHDWNGYIDIPLEFSEYVSLQAELENKKSEPLLKILNFQFLFSPQKGLLIQDKIFQEIERAKEKVQILSFDHYDQILSHVLKKASARGVKVEIVQNKPLDEEGKYLAQEFFFGDSRIYEDGNTDRVFVKDSKFPEAGLLHHKTILIDNKILMTGSYNFSLSARDSNREIFLFTQEQTAVEEFTKEFLRIQIKSYPQEMQFSNLNYIFKDEVQNLNFPKTCYSSKIPSGVWELGDGLFFSYLYFSKTSSCFEYSKRSDISSGLGSFSMKEEEMKSIWKAWSFYPRFGNSKYSNQEGNFAMPSTQWINIKIEEQPLFAYTVELDNNSSEIQVYIPDYGFVEPIHFLTNKTISFSIQKKIKEMVILQKKENQLFFSCVLKDKPSKKLEFILGKLFLYSNSTKANNCISY